MGPKKGPLLNKLQPSALERTIQCNCEPLDNRWYDPSFARSCISNDDTEHLQCEPDAP